MRNLVRTILGMVVFSVGIALVSGCADKPGPPPGAPPATINQQRDQQTMPTYGQTREEQKEGQ